MAAPHQFLHAAVLDLLLLIGWLLAIIFERRKLAALLGLCTILAILITPRPHAPAYPPPPPIAIDTTPVSLLLKIHEVPRDEPWAAVAGGVLPADKGAEWTWTNQRPHLRFMIDESRRWVFYLRFAVAGAVLRAVGTQTVQVAINDVVVKSVTAAEPREYEVRFGVHPAVLKPGMNDVELRVAPVFIAGDGVRLGVLLHSAGFMEERIP